MEEPYELLYKPEEIIDLQKEVVELDETFRIVNHMVFEQGEKIDNLDDIIDKTLESTEKANEQLVEANESFLSSIRKKVILIGGGIAIVGCFLIIF